MIRSMTAFSGAETELGNLTVSCEIRSVNHRYCDITLKLPDRLRFLEVEMRSAISAKINRGKIECTVNCKKQTKSGQSFYVNPDAVIALLEATQAIEQQMSGALAFSALDVLAFPGIQQEPDVDSGSLNEGVMRMITEALTSLVATRQREGAQLKLLIEERCAKMRSLVMLAEQRMPEVLQLVRIRLKDRIIELVAQPDFDRLEQELVILTQKLDIAEELDRLNTHITEVLRALTQPEAAGRRLDFLMQELNREANTIGSKSNDKEMTRISIELKVLIEQMREQIQNIE
ncbi:YicC/YloC family endoribonuclease [Crenothrix sp.]|uniref:YicC/YloC family endoribonuclease n=1 Tax=Crenothrix sp. TaxID=3100433 RepID=UPI00374D9FB4